MLLKRPCLFCKVSEIKNHHKDTKYCSRKCFADKRTGIFRSKEIKLKISKARKGQHAGANHHGWIKDRNLVKGRQNRNNPAYKQWRIFIWNRDKYTCLLKDKYCCGKIEAHHILKWSEYPDLRYQINNGITLCHFHHPRKVVEEKRLVPVFQKLVSVSNDINCHTHILR